LDKACRTSTLLLWRRHARLINGCKPEEKLAMSRCAKNKPKLTAIVIVLAIAVGGFTASQWVIDYARAGEQAAGGKEAKRGPLKHVVLFKFKDEATKEQVQEVVDAFSAMPKQIDAIAGFEMGTDVSVEKLSQGFTHCFVVTFKDAAARDEYLPHPVHKKFVDLALPRIDKVLVVDYYVEK
jgi:hypothetical protein